VYSCHLSITLFPGEEGIQVSIVEKLVDKEERVKDLEKVWSIAPLGAEPSILKYTVLL